MSDQPPSDILTRRVLLELPGMADVTVRRGVEYRRVDSEPLTMDLYSPPPRWPEPATRPAVVIVAGYAGRYNTIGWTISMAQLMAASGLVAVAYGTHDPAADTLAVFDYLLEHAASLQIDPSKLGIMSGSGNVPTALALLLKDAPHSVSCAALFCGYMLDLDDATGVADASAEWHFANPCSGRSVADLRRDVPLFIARAGRDQFAGVNDSIDRFVAVALAENLPVTLVNHAEGPHAFDLLDDSATSRGIVLQALGFLQRHLLA